MKRSRNSPFSYGIQVCLTCCLFFLSACFLCQLGMMGTAGAVSTLKPELSGNKEPSFTVVLDAGHGGEDGGAVGKYGTSGSVLEKDLNLSIATKIKEMLEEKGYRVVMTRTEDKLLYTEEQNIYGQRKQYDLKNRLEIVKKAENPILVSIHMNRFSQEKYSGMQVYYSQNHADSQRIASIIQKTVRERIQPYNRRQIKKATSAIYLLNRATVPAVLIECGFLSNREECKKLSTEEYQKELSFSIVCAIIEYMEQAAVQGGDS